jgi:ketosteroid isomerase-like protein
MRRFTAHLLFWLTPWIAVAGVAGQQPVPRPNPEWLSALRAVVESEQAFARSAAEKGTRDAFLAFIAEDAVLFRPQPVPGKKYLLDRPAAPGKLSWRPVFADVSASGDLGYTTGPYEFRKIAADAVPSSYGNYFTIWKKQPDGTWKFVIDFGTSNPEPKKALPDFDPKQAKPAIIPKAGATAENAAADLILFERRLSSISAIQGASALQAFAAADARFLRPDRQPAIGITEVRTVLTAEPGAWTWEPIKSGASSSGDLGFTYGTCELHTKAATGKPTQLGYYLRVYKRQPDGEWKMVAEVVNF